MTHILSFVVLALIVAIATPALAQGKKPWSWSKCIRDSQPYVTRPGTDITWCAGKRAEAQAKGRPIVK
jgi:hypothetical protein